MKIVLAPNAFKGSVTAVEAAAAMARGVRRVLTDGEIVEVPLSDGGDGLHDLAVLILGGETVPVTVTGPRFDPVEAGFVLERGTGVAVIEMARASGLALLAGQTLDPTRTTTLGTGELIRAALDSGARHVMVGIGGSATNDGGVGMATALGWRFLDADGSAVTPVGGALTRIESIDGAHVDTRLAATRIDVVCDVDNPLCGPRGASAVYGPQKGATPEQVDSLDRGLAHLADVTAATRETDERHAPGTGAAGGLGFGLRVFAGGTLRHGTDVIFEAVRFDEHLRGADLVLTGEGRIDTQTVMGKAPGEVASRARAAGVPCFALAGSVEDGLDALHRLGIHAVFSICRSPRDLEESMANASSRLADAAEEAVRVFLQPS